MSTQQLNSQNLEVLLIEDDLDFVHLFLAAAELGAVKFKISSVANGVEAMHFLRHQAQFKNAPKPDVIFLDINLPGKSGREIFGEIKKDPVLKLITVVLLTTMDVTELQTEFQLPKNYCHTKPTSIKEYVAMMHGVEKDVLRERLAKI